MLKIELCSLSLLLPFILSLPTISHLFRELRHVLCFFRVAEIAFQSVAIYEYSEHVVVWPTLYLYYLSNRSRLAFTSKRNNPAQTATAGHGIHFNFLMISDITRCALHAKTEGFHLSLRYQTSLFEDYIYREDYIYHRPEIIYLAYKRSHNE
jgi:hypothetical protein